MKGNTPPWLQPVRCAPFRNRPRQPVGSAVLKVGCGDLRVVLERSPGGPQHSNESIIHQQSAQIHHEYPYFDGINQSNRNRLPDGTLEYSQCSKSSFQSAAHPLNEWHTYTNLLDGDQFNTAVDSIRSFWFSSGENANTQMSTFMQNDFSLYSQNLPINQKWSHNLFNVNSQSSPLRTDFWGTSLPGVSPSRYTSEHSAHQRTAHKNRRGSDSRCHVGLSVTVTLP